MRLLCDVGARGLALTSIVKHVYNAHNSLFEPIKERNVYQSVRSFMIRNSQSPLSLFIRMEDGKYKVNRQSPKFLQMKISFDVDNSNEILIGVVMEEPTLPFDF